MVLRCRVGDWDAFLRKYRRSDNQWYLIPKAKAFSEESFHQIIIALKILRDWFSEPDALPPERRGILDCFMYDPQGTLYGDDSAPTRWGPPAQVFFTAQLFLSNVISRGQQTVAQRAQFDRIIESVVQRESYLSILEQFHRQVLIEEFAANSRNLINIFQRLGLAWIEPDHLVAMTSVGNAFIDHADSQKVLLEQQLRRLQIYNPTFDRAQTRYGQIKVFPFSFCLRLIVGLSVHEITLDEFALFVTKAVSMDELDSCLAWITEFRSLTLERRQEILQTLKRRQRGRARPMLVEALETSRKNINLLTLCGPWVRSDTGGSEGIALSDLGRANEIIDADRSLEFVDFESREAWFCEYGNIDSRFDVDTAIDYYARIGRIDKARKVAEKASDRRRAQERLQDRLYEKYIEDFYKQRLNLIEAGLVLYAPGERTGQQFETPDAGTIDLLTKGSDNAFVVIEFKRDKASDDALGQLLRYMGWVRKNLSPNGPVRGYIVAYDFEKFLYHAIRGMQHPLIPNRDGRSLVNLTRHSFDVSRMGAVDIDAPN